MEHYRNHFIEYYAYDKDEETAWETYCQEKFGVTYDEFKAETENYAKESVAGNLLIRSIAKIENVTYTDEQMTALIEGIYQEQGQGYFESVEEMVTGYMDVYGADYFEHQLITANVLEILYQHAVKEGA